MASRHAGEKQTEKKCSLIRIGLRLGHRRGRAGAMANDSKKGKVNGTEGGERRARGKVNVADRARDMLHQAVHIQLESSTIPV